jgi:hypothetical protein
VGITVIRKVLFWMKKKNNIFSFYKNKEEKMKEKIIKDDKKLIEKLSLIILVAIVN